VHAVADWAIAFADSHALLAYALALLLAASESLPVVGALVPGSGVIVALAALIAAGALRFWPFVAAVILGAVLGDGFSFELGRRYHAALLTRWPLNRHPEVAARGEALFRRHGGKSVVIARFTPGVRAIVPMLAGILEMSRTRFFLANIASAIAWGLSHVLSGVLLGASLELLGAVAGRLAVLAALLVVLAYAVVVASRWAARRAPLALAAATAPLAAWAERNPGWLARRVHRIVTADRAEALALGVAAALLAGGLWLLLGVLQDIISGDPLVRLDSVVLHGLTTLRSHWGDGAMRVLAATGSPVALIFLAVGTLLVLALFRQWLFSFAWLLGLAGAAGLGALLGLLPHAAPVAAAPEVASAGADTVFAILAVTAYSLVGFFCIRAAPSRWQPAVASAVTLIVVFGAAARLYLGLTFLSTEIIAAAFALTWIGLVATIALLGRLPPARVWGVSLVALPVLLGAMAAQATGSALIAAPPPPPAFSTHPMTLEDWRAGAWDTLPGSRIGLLGNYTRPFTLQWAGSIASLADALEAHGWHRPPPWTLASTLAWLTPSIDPASLPALPRFADGIPEALVLVHPEPGNGPPTRLVLRLWPSDAAVVVGDRALPLWLGGITKERFRRIAATITIGPSAPAAPGTRAALAADLPAARLVSEAQTSSATNSGNDASATVLLGWDAPALAAQPCVAPACHGARPAP
jgi:membrane protein DedA with SNARE-associated domain